MSKPRKKKRTPKRVLALPDLEQSKTAVLNSLTSRSGQRTYDRAITDFVDWYCSEPRLAFNRTVVLRYRIFLERNCTHRRRSTSAWPPSDAWRTRRPIRACSVRSLRLGSDGSKKCAGSGFASAIGSRPSKESDFWKELNAILFVARETTRFWRLLIGCGLSRGELLALPVGEIQLREEHWVIADLPGKAGHVRTVPVPGWVKEAIDDWKEASGIT
jgi:integrase